MRSLVLYQNWRKDNEYLHSMLGTILLLMVFVFSYIVYKVFFYE